MHVTVTTPPTAVVTLAEAKAHLRVDHNDEDTLIESLVAAATGWIDGPAGWLGRSIGVQTLEARFEELDCNEIKLPYGPIISITTVKYLDEDNVEQTFSSASYTLLSDGRVVLNTDESWPDLYDDKEAVRIRYQAGYATVPQPIKFAILLMVGFLYSAREASADEALTSGAVHALLSPFRVWSI